jgi:hypothetical protein
LGGSVEAPADPRNGVAELLENDIEGVVGLTEDAGLALKDEMVEMRFNHEEGLFMSSRSLPSMAGDTSWSVFDMSDRRAPTELCRESDCVEF